MPARPKAIPLDGDQVIGIIQGGARTKLHSASQMDAVPNSVRAFLAERRSPDSCWLPRLKANPTTGYIRIGDRNGGKQVDTLFHRAVYVIAVGDIPAGLVIDHLCGVKRCANPGHLEAVTLAENTARGGSAFSAVNAAKTECPYGHPLVDGNLVSCTAKAGWRACLTCQRERSRESSRLRTWAAHHLGMTRNAYERAYGSSRQAAFDVLARSA